MSDISLEDLQALNTINQKTWGWGIRASSERGDGEFQKFTIQAVDPFTKTWYTTDGETISLAIEKFIKIIEV